MQLWSHTALEKTLGTHITLHWHRRYYSRTSAELFGQIEETFSITIGSLVNLVLGHVPYVEEHHHDLAKP